MVASRSAARRAIADRRVRVDGVPAPRPATLVAPSTGLHMQGAEHVWASRAGRKLAKALDAFSIDVAGRRALDVGASTGGFTDVLLQRGAAAVTALDVGYGQLLWRLRRDPRVIVVDRTNFRHVDPGELGAPFDLVTMDVSFISVTLLVGQLAACGRLGTDYIVLVKPQFEAGRDRVQRGGLVTDPAVHAATLGKVADALGAAGIGTAAACRSPITGAAGNREFLLHGRLGGIPRLTQAAIDEVVRA